MSLDLEQFCKAIDIIVSERLSNMSFDNTMICTIMDASDKERGHYIVSDGTIRFDAYTNDTSYQENDQVRVSVLNGNFNERKFIEGPYIGDTTGAPVSYVSPLSTALPLESNAIEKMGSPQNITSYQIHTNTDDEVLLWEVDISNDAKYQTLQSNGIYNTITLSADFMTNLGNLTQGNYGLVLDFFIKQSQDSNNYTHRYVTFDSSEMIGNPYSFELYSHQEKKINIAAFGMISMIRLSMYEGVKFSDSGNDNEINGRLGSNRIENPFLDENNNILSAQPINVRNIKLGFGNDLVAVTNNTLQLYTTSPIYYNYYDHTDATNSKNLGLLWLNKTEDNEYIGYSDGIFDLDYDEIQYRKNANGNSRLEAQMNKVGIADDEESLTLAANIAEAESYMIKTYELITTDLSQVLQALKRQIPGAPDILTQLIPLIENWDSGNVDNSGNKIYNAPLLNQYAYSASQAVSKLVKFYSQILNYGYNKQNSISPNVWNEQAIKISGADGEYPNSSPFYIAETDPLEKKNDLAGVVDWDYDYYYRDFKTNIGNAITAVVSFFTHEENGMTAQTAPGEILSGYAGICDTYQRRANAVISIIRDNLDRIDKIVDGDVGKLQDYHEVKEDYTSYNNVNAKKELSKDDNKYCIYWYHYAPGFTLEYDDSEGADNTEYLYGNFAGPNWKRILYIPKVFADETKFTQYKESGKSIYTVALNEKKEPVFSEVTTWNENTKYYIECKNVGLPQSRSNIKVVNEKNEEVKDDQGNNLYYNLAQGLEEEKTLTLYLNPSTQEEKIKVIIFKNHEMITSNVIEFENKDEVPEDKLVDASDVLRIEHDAGSQDHYQVYSSAYDLVDISDGSKMRQLKCYYDGILSGDETLVDSWLYWYVPTNATLLTYDKDYLVNTLGFSTDAEQKTEFSLDNYVYFAKKVEKEEEETTDDESETPVIKLKDATRIFAYKIKSFYEPSATNNTILVKARIPGYQATVNGDKYFSFSTFGNNGTKYTLAITPASNRVGYCTAVKTEDVEIEGGINLKVSLKDAEDKSLQMCKDSTGTGNLVDIKFLTPSGRTLPIENYQEIENSLDWNVYIHEPNLWDKGEAAKHFIGIVQANVALYNDITNKNVTLSALYPVPYSANPEYYISGPTVIVYNNQGTVSRISEAPYKLFKHSIDGDVAVTPNDPATEDIVWTLSYYDDRGNEIDINEDTMTQDNIYSYMPKLNQDNTLTPAPMYFTYEVEDSEGNTTSQQYYPVAKCEIVKKSDSKHRTLLWSQPIVITQNKYASSTLNNWDGSFTIDEANGTLMATMLGAGKKTSNNTFEGVLIGDIVEGAHFDHDNASGIGIYGFNDGDQSFHFGTDGTAFIGKAGRGRIYFNGNSGTISSASYQQNRGTDAGAAGMLIDLDDGFIDIKGTKVEGSSEPGHENYVSDGYSAHITLNAKADELNPYFRISTPNINKEDEWNNKDLIHIGLEEYFLQTENYESGTFSIKDKELNAPGKGMKIDLMGAYVNAFNLQLMSKNLLLDCTSETGPYFIIKADSGNNLMYVSSNKYYLKTNDYNEDVSDGKQKKGLKIDLSEGSIKAYDSFSLEAGTETYGGVMLNANPGSGENYLYAGKNSVGYIKIDDSHNMSLMATIFTLQTNKKDGNNIYLSNTGTIWTINTVGTNDDETQKTKDIADTVLGLGKNFAVDSSGNLYAKDANLTNVTATGGTFANISATDMNVKTGTIGGWEITTTLLQHKSGSIALDGTNGQIYAGDADAGTGFNLSSGGYLTATGSKLTTLTVSKSASFTDTCAVTIDGTMKITKKGEEKYALTLSGDAYVEGEIQMSPGEKGNIRGAEGSWISFGGSGGAGYGIWVYGGLGLEYNTKLQIPDTTYVSNGKYVIQLKDYVGVAIDETGNGVAIKAQNLVNNSGSITIKAPSAVGAKGQVLSTTDDAGASTWASLGSLLNTATSNADNGKFLKAGNTGDISWTKLYVPSGVGTLNQVWATTNATAGSEAANWTSISTLLSSMTGVANNTYLRGFKAGETASVAWSNICFPTSYSGTANTVWTTTTASGEDASGAGGWKTIPSLLGATTNTNQVLVSTGSTTTPATSWKTIGATLVNFTDGTSTGITKKTAEDGAIYYTVTASDTYNKATKSSAKTGSATAPSVYLCWKDANATGQYVVTDEIYDSNQLKNYDHYTLVSKAGRTATYTYYDISETSATVSVSKDIKINVSLT